MGIPLWHELNYNQSKTRAWKLEDSISGSLPIPENSGDSPHRDFPYRRECLSEEAEKRLAFSSAYVIGLEDIFFNADSLSIDNQVCRTPYGVLIVYEPYGQTQRMNVHCEI